jgi:hypothetical protein
MARRRGGSSRTDNWLGILQARGVQRGILGSSRTWMWIAVGSFIIRRVRRFAGSEPQIVFRGELKPGQTLRIDHLTEIYNTTKRQALPARKR